MLANNDIRKYAKEKGVKLYEVTAVMNKSQSYLTRKLYFELPQDEKQRIFDIIDQIAAEKENAAD